MKKQVLIASAIVLCSFANEQSTIAEAINTCFFIVTPRFTTCCFFGVRVGPDQIRPHLRSFSGRTRLVVWMSERHLLHEPCKDRSTS